MFDPVVIDPPVGAEAVRRWELTVGWLDHPQLCEIRRPKRPADLELIAEAFAPHLEARDWTTIEKKAP